MPLCSASARNCAGSRPRPAAPAPRVSALSAAAAGPLIDRLPLTRSHGGRWPCPEHGKTALPAPARPAARAERLGSPDGTATSQAAGRWRSICKLVRRLPHESEKIPFRTSPRVSMIRRVTITLGLAACLGMGGLECLARTVTDDLGRGFEVRNPPLRIVSL